jgi:hypothetical protein
MTKKELDHKYYLAVKDTPEYKERRAKTQRKYRQGHRELINRLSREWSRKQPKAPALPKSERPPKERKPKVYNATACGGYKVRLKIEVLSHYGPDGKLQCAWPDCTVTDVDMLSLDHINNDGAQDRKSGTRGGGGNKTYCRVRKQGFPDGFQTLCHNHQWKKELMLRREKWK